MKTGRGKRRAEMLEYLYGHLPPREEPAPAGLSSRLAIIATPACAGPPRGAGIRQIFADDRFWITPEDASDALGRLNRWEGYREIDLQPIDQPICQPEKKIK